MLAVVKLIPFVGWLVSGLLCALMTYLLGEAAIRYYEADAKAPLRDSLRLMGLRHWLAQKRAAARPKVRRPRWIRARPVSEEDEMETEIIPVTTAAAVVLAEADGVSPNANNVSDTRQTPQRPLTLEDLT